MIVVEAAEGSGSLITARDALDQGRDVLAVPGHPFDARATGCNTLIRGGAILVRDVADVIDALEGSLLTPPPTKPDPAKPLPLKPPRAAPKPAAAKPLDTLALHRMILSALGPNPVAEDQLLRDLGLLPAAVAPALLFLELDGRVQRQPGGMLALT